MPYERFASTGSRPRGPREKGVAMSKDVQEFLASLSDRTEPKWGHPELEAAYEALKSNDTDGALNPDHSFESRKANVEAQIAAFNQMGMTTAPGTEVYQAKGCPEDPDAPAVNVYVWRPEGHEGKALPCVFVIPGGGMYFSSPDFIPLPLFAQTYGAVAVTMSYRTLYQDEGHSYPDSVNDCHAAYAFVVEHADELGIDTDRIVIQGDSTGGHLSLALAHRLKRYGWCGAPMPRGVVADIPVIDCQDTTPSMRYDGPGWTGIAAQRCGLVWLEGKGKPAENAAESFPSFATTEDCIGLPPTFIHTGDSDPGVDPDFIYASQLIEAGVFCEIHCWGGNNHGAIMNARGTDMNARYRSVLEGEIRDCLQYDFRRAWLREE